MIMLSKEWKEIHRSSLLYIIIALVVLSTWFVFYQFHGLEQQISFRTGLIPVFQTSSYFLPLLAMVYGAISMALEKNQRTFLILVARGTTIQSFVYKKWITLISVFIPSIAVSYFIAMIPGKIVFGTVGFQAFSSFLLAVIILSTIFLSIGIALGSLIDQKLQLIGAVIGIWIILIYLFDLVLMYWLSSVSLDNVMMFSVLYFLSPVNAIRYFLFTQLNVYQLSDMSVVYEQFTFQMPWLVLTVNFLLWIGLILPISIYALKRKGISHD
ncbi:ABC transporter permease [Virgibacillus sp. MSP4-1]|uniref:ABC transporter permease n=1 Tax=Virgibacillus sp. MSP4-1 TaxID=2700081 RepID=UPI0003A7DBFE|nr:ABC transporter permease subunit [Virgibacillus sp. MSP4-1]QHS24169.1 ABC transporter permease [Virgibacillus sp. MSP4-1]